MLSPLPLLKALTIRKTLIAVFFTVVVALFVCWVAVKPDKEISAHLNDAYGKFPLQFEPNEGQAAPDVEFLTRGSDYTLFLKQTEAVLSLHKQDVRLKVFEPIL